jgi:hypothetical protein
VVPRRLLGDNQWEKNEEVLEELQVGDSNILGEEARNDIANYIFLLTYMHELVAIKLEE